MKRCLCHTKFQNNIWYQHDKYVRYLVKTIENDFSFFWISGFFISKNHSTCQRCYYDWNASFTTHTHTRTHEEECQAEGYKRMCLQTCKQMRIKSASPLNTMAIKHNSVTKFNVGTANGWKELFFFCLKNQKKNKKYVCTH